MPTCSIECSREEQTDSSCLQLIWRTRIGLCFETRPIAFSTKAGHWWRNPSHRAIVFSSRGRPSPQREQGLLLAIIKCKIQVDRSTWVQFSLPIHGSNLCRSLLNRPRFELSTAGLRQVCLLREHIRQSGWSCLGLRRPLLELNAQIRPKK